MVSAYSSKYGSDTSLQFNSSLLFMGSNGNYLLRKFVSFINRDILFDVVLTVFKHSLTFTENFLERSKIVLIFEKVFST